MPRRRKRRREEEDKDEFPVPDGKEMMLGVIQQFLGYDRARVLCADGKLRLCRIPGRMKKRVWMRLGDVVLVAPWEFQRDERGDIVHRYTSTQLQKLDEMGLLEDLRKVLESLE